MSFFRRTSRKGRSSAGSEGSNSKSETEEDSAPRSPFSLADSRSPSVRWTVSERSSRWGVEEDPAAESSLGAEKVYVAVPRDVNEGKANVLWVLNNVNSEEQKKKIVLVHIHRPAQRIRGMLGAMVPASQLREDEVEAYRQLEMEAANKKLHEYVKLCAREKVRAEKLVIANDDVGEGLLAVIAQHRVTKFVMGAAADRHHSTEMKEPMSRTAKTVKEKVKSYCTVWFVCKGNLICTREAGLEGPVSLTPPRSDHSEEPSATSTPERKLTTEEGKGDPGIWISSSLCPEHSLSMVSDKDLGSSGSLWMPKEQETDENRSSFSPSMHGFDDLQHSPSHYDLGIARTDDEMYAQLHLTSLEAENLRRELSKELCRRRSTERYLNQTKQEVNVLENLYSKEVQQKKRFEEETATQKIELEKLRKQYDEVLEHLEKVQSEYEELKRERANAVTFSKFEHFELKEATQDFNNSVKIGEGGYGSVYKGFVRHTWVAIKKLNPQSKQGNVEFNQEVDVLSKLSHPNLVTLIGACPEACALIYELLPNGSLEDHLTHKDGNRRPPLIWHARIRIAAEVCSALIFLHSHKPEGVIHGDLKPSNILLDVNFVSKLGDFGISRRFTPSTTSSWGHFTAPKGSIGYLDPEFMSSGKLTTRSDVFSFGVVLLRLLTGKEPYGIVDEVKKAKEEERLLDLLDKSAGEWPSPQAQQLAELALRCCERDRSRRPDLAGEAWPLLQLTLTAASP